MSQLIKSILGKTKEMAQMEPEHILTAKNCLFEILDRSKEEQIEMLAFIKKGMIENTQDHVERIKKI